MKLGKKNRCLSFLGQVGLFSDVMEKTERKSRSHAPGEGQKRDLGTKLDPVLCGQMDLIVSGKGTTWMKSESKNCDKHRQLSIVRWFNCLRF